MKKLDFKQMENVQGGWSKSDWCLVSVIFAVGAGLVTGGAAGAAVIAGAAATGLSC